MEGNIKRIVSYSTYIRKFKKEAMSESSVIRPSAPSLFSPPLMQKRILACVRCQQRKIKCERKFPCAQCNAAREQCVPATRSRNVRRKRRFPERELLERIRMYEDLLRQNNISFEPLHRDQVVIKNPSEDHDATISRSAATDHSSLLTVGSETRFEVKSLLNSLASEYAGLESDSDSSEDHHIRDFLYKRAWENFCINNDHFVFGSLDTDFDLSALHPESAHIFKLWQIYLDNVDPLLKVTHAPSLQRQVIDAASNRRKLKPAFEALLFSIYCVALKSMALEGDVQSIFGASKSDLLARFQWGCQKALLKCGFLQSKDRDCLTALFLYLVSIDDKIGPWSTSSVLGIAIRIAQHMAIHNESALATCTVFEAELRRRLWWALVLFDARISEISGHKCTTLEPSWDCRIPLGLNDSDFRPEMKVMPDIRRPITDTLFVVIRSELGDFIRRAKFHLEYTNPALKPIISDAHDEITPESAKLDTLEKAIEDRYLNSLDPEVPVHFFAICSTRIMIARWRLLQLHSTSSSRTEAQEEDLVSLSLQMLENDTKIVTSPLIRGFSWMTNLYFPYIAYVQLLLYLRKRPTGKQAEQGWEIMSANYEAHMHTHIAPFVETFTKMILFAWRAREAALQMPPVPPKMISIIRQKDTERYQDCGQGTEEISVNVGEHRLANGQERQDEYMYSESYFANTCEQSIFEFDYLREFDWASWDWQNNAEMGSDEFASF
ncbi:Transcription factor [Penicillium occitanis (nom. inval.)]|nr:Transcription factor [Penicillium occitanis (nom. inval.)]PCH00473.1 hypothetical protein PENOC_053000 [Penicillium occitanis (nom. inval.)]